MILDFSKVNCKERPTLILRTMDGTAIQTLGYAFGVSLESFYNEVSTLSFSFPAHVDGRRVPGYEKLSGMKIVEMLGVGQFIINNPSIKESATKEIKDVKAYSLEYEFTFKKLTLTNSTYNFWNPATPDNTIMGIILEKMPSWNIGYVDSTLVGKYRTFEVSGQNLYDLMKGTLQDSYGCVFDFDTMNRLINVRDVSSACSTQPVYISLDNLAKEIAIEEQTENIFTCLDVNGAEGVNIRGVNPTGKNTIYDLGYFMNKDNFSQELIDKWNNWVQGVESRRQEYYNLTVENALLHMQIETENAALGTLQGDLKILENQQAVAVESAAKGITTDLATYKSQIAAKQSEISAKESYIATLNAQLKDSQDNLVAINEACQWNKYGITAEDEKVLDRYIREDAIADSSFVCPTVDSYAATGNSYPKSSVSVSLSGSTITGATLTSGKQVYSARGGTATIAVNGETKLSGTVKQAAFDTLSGAGTACFYLETGCVTVSGTYSLTTNCKPDPDIGGAYIEGTTASISGSSVDVYITTQLTAYSQRAVEWDLYEYGREALNRLAYPSYTFSVDSGNFLAIEEFDAFRRQLRLGDKLYLNLGNSFGVLQPVLIGATIDFESNDLQLEFSDSFSLADSAFKLADLLDQSVSMGKSIDLNKYNYNAFVNAGGTSGVQQLMNTMTDLAVTTIKSSGNQAWSLDDAGLRLRKYKGASKTEYMDDQIWMSNNMIAFTRDNWNSAIMAMGAFTDENFKDENGNSISMYGIVAPNIVGTLLAGKNLVIESEKQDGGVSVFKVDADGAKLYNSQFDLVNEYTSGGTTKVGQISLHPSVGIAAGSLSAENGFYAYDSDGNIEGIKATDGSRLLSVSDIGIKTPLTNFWIDTNGNAYLKGTVYATDGKFTGTVQATDFLDSSGNSMLENGKWNQDHLNIKSLNINDGKFVVDQSGNVTMSGSINMSAASSITWASAPIQYQYSSDNKTWHTTQQTGDKYRRESFDGKTWGVGYQFIGTDGTNGTNGKDGSDASVTAANIVSALVGNTNHFGIEATKIGQGYVYSPAVYGGNIYGAEFHGNEFNIYPDGVNASGSLNMYGYYNSNWLHALGISYSTGTSPTAVFYSNGGAYAHWNFDVTYVNGSVSFPASGVSGIYQISKYSPQQVSASPNSGYLYFQVL